MSSTIKAALLSYLTRVGYPVHFLTEILWLCFDERLLTLVE
ncbi:MAG: hypothetical protein ACR2PX_00485 [Endozoicomonas sp.]